MTSVGQEGEQVTEYDNTNNSIAVSWCPERTCDDMADLFRKLRYAVDSANREAVADVIGFPSKEPLKNPLNWHQVQA